MISVKVLRRLSIIFLFSSIFLIPIFLLEFIVGILFKSYILIADSYHTLIDFLISLLFYFTLVKINTRSRRFPWGLYNLESLVILATSIFIVYLSANLILSMFDSSITFSISPWYSIILFASSIYSLALYFVERRYAEIQIVKNDMVHSFLDSIAEVVSGITLIVQNMVLIDVVTLAILTFTLSDVIREIKDSILSILGASIDSPMKFQLINELRSKNIPIINLYLKRCGSFYAVYAYIGLPKDITLEKAYKIKRKTKRIIKKYDNIACIDVILVPLTEIKKKKILEQVNTLYSR
ncbi:cation diffusion facilitator family transporter [Sulfolobus islandicus Y.G.57.14]|uniref:Cation diffusion facilitator family transporter n=3 Tax=Saccharolobus islandicus TaxID=43080 RepID=C3MJC2_SACI2|nr:cation transporter [Sulfolobus islandicus]ACP34200.1 cation diffusion facilitator family transporter [Sulfolobus islandicus L.S.2.15]ACP44340.1 cation diffusion facilitator family transporter [Sulfolobus islandicus Y.G.57.14]ACP47245.1 cation diffusion facilitator family transporter [Sulfolobus islandicus Y.N.15.51]PVU78371.1 cation diffusion facilitator family transporter [Sulfolobus islandicus]